MRLFDGDFRHLRAAAVVRRPRRWQLRDDEVRERAVDLGAPELARDVPFPGRRPLTGPQSHSVLRLKRDRPSGWAAARLRSDELLIGSFAGSLRRRELDRVPRWRGDHVTVKQVVDDFARYLDPPRLQAPRGAAPRRCGRRRASNPFGMRRKPRKPRIRWGNRRSVRVRTGQKTPGRTRNAGSTAGSGEPSWTSDVVQPSLRGGDAGRPAVRLRACGRALSTTPRQRRGKSWPRARTRGEHLYHAFERRRPTPRPAAPKSRPSRGAHPPVSRRGATSA